MFVCERCGASFPKNQGLVKHIARKRPCVAPVATTAHTCDKCGRSLSNASNLTRHKQKFCHPPAIARIEQLEAEVTALRALTKHTERTNTTITGNTVSINNIAHNTINNVTVTIAPWGSPLALTDADVEAALASIPGVAGTPAMPEVVAALMELVKRAHMPDAARNVYLNPRRGDQALACTAAGSWAAMPLTEATAVLFDGASARIATPTTRRRVNALHTAVPVQYRADKALAVQLGLRPMEAHLANMAPGGPGPLMLEGPAVAAEAAGAAAQPRLDPVEAAALVKRLPASYEPGGAVTAEWLAAVLAETGACTADLIRALRSASARGLCGFAEWQGIMRLGAPPAQ